MTEQLSMNMEGKLSKKGKQPLKGLQVGMSEGLSNRKSATWLEASQESGRGQRGGWGSGHRRLCRLG